MVEVVFFSWVLFVNKLMLRCLQKITLKIAPLYCYLCIPLKGFIVKFFPQENSETQPLI